MLKRLTIPVLCLLMVTGLLFVGCSAQPSVAPEKELEEQKPAVGQHVIAGLGRDPGEMYGYGAHPPLTRIL
ncbi:MAG: hypothetical protein GX263_04060, partial [Firmicutes bacterium]|nr:hypothetical protein [Bacillota bacterium]